MELLKIENEFDHDHILTFTNLGPGINVRYPIEIFIKGPNKFQISLEEAGKLIVALATVLVSEETK